MIRKSIVIEIGGEDIHFEMSGHDYRTYQDEITLTKKSAPSDRLCLATVVADDKAKLQPYLEQGFGLDIAAALVEQYSEGVRIVAKKPSAG